MLVNSCFMALTNTIYVPKFLTLFSFCSKKKSVISAVIHKTLVRIANTEDPDQTAASSEVCTVFLGLFA